MMLSQDLHYYRPPAVLTQTAAVLEHLQPRVIHRTSCLAAHSDLASEGVCISWWIAQAS